MEQGTRWAVRGDHLRGRDDSAMPTLERCCQANSARGAAQSPHAWHVGDRKAVSHAGRVAIARGRPIFFLQVRARGATVTQVHFFVLEGRTKQSHLADFRGFSLVQQHSCAEEPNVSWCDRE